MQIIAKLIDGVAVPYTRAELQAEYPETIFPEVINDEALEACGCVNVVPVEAPAATLETNVVEAPYSLVDGQWYQQWSVEPATADQIAQRSAIQLDLLVGQYTAMLERHYDTRARERKYDNRYTCALRAGYAGPFQAEGEAFALWMDNCNAYAYQVMADVQLGQRTMPSVEELLAELPSLVWP